MATHGPSSETSSNTLTEVNTNATNYTTRSVALFKVVASHSLITPKVLNWDYEGSGTVEDPFVVEFIPNDPRDPLNFSSFKKWAITLLVAFVTLAVAFASSAYSGGVGQIIKEFHCSEEVVTLGISLFVLGVRSYSPITPSRHALMVACSLQSALFFGRLSRSCMAVKSYSLVPTAS